MTVFYGNWPEFARLHTRPHMEWKRDQALREREKRDETMAEHYALLSNFAKRLHTLEATMKALVIATGADVPAASAKPVSSPPQGIFDSPTDDHIPLSRDSTWPATDMVGPDPTGDPLN